MLTWLKSLPHEVLHLTHPSATLSMGLPARVGKVISPTTKVAVPTIAIY
ncbi:hypothetical protein DSBG_2358 [Desulfosporosinus sp. BG]|nr:hypothetical protein DSBG_2358 [Desulfosporosinus sp. BG]